MTKRKQIFIIAAVTDNPDAWTLTAKKDGKGMVFSASIGGVKLSKQDIKFINNHLKRFDAVKDSLAGGEALESDN